LFNQNTGYNHITVAEFLMYLFEKHGKIKPADLELNDACMTTPWDGA
jgi:hypothetical protein